MFLAGYPRQNRSRDILRGVVREGSMRRVLRAIGFMSAAVAATAPAAGADLMAVPRVTAASWTGFYAGISVGERWTRADWDPLVFDPRSVGIVPLGSDNLASIGGTAPRFGGYLGYNIQRDIWVVGVEADVGIENNRRSVV